MAKKGPRTGSEKMVQQMEKEYRKDPDGLASLGTRLPRGAHGSLNDQVVSLIRAEYESGVKIAELGRRHQVSPRTIHRWKVKQGWERDEETAADVILDRARKIIRDKAERQEIEVQTELESVIRRQKAVSQTLMEMMNETLARAMAYPAEDPFKQLLIVKVASEIHRNVTNLDRKVWGLDEKAQTSATAIYEVLQGMEDTVEKKSIRIEEKYS